MWIRGEEEDLNVALDPLFSASYILLTTSLASVAVKIMIPVIIDKFSNPSTVTVSGSNSLVIFLLRAAIWFGGLYLALDELGFELLGLLASLAVFSVKLSMALDDDTGHFDNDFNSSLVDVDFVGRMVRHNLHLVSAEEITPASMDWVNK